MPRRDDDAALWSIVEAVEAETGEGFFRSLVRHVAEALRVEYAFVSELSADATRFRTLALWGRGRELADIEVAVSGTPCEAVLGGEPSHHPERLRELFPRDSGLADWGVESYCGAPLVASSGRVTGHLAIFDVRPMPDPRGLAILRIFAARARAEIERREAERRLRESEARFRELIEGAPVPFMSVGTDWRILDFNRRFVEWSGFTPGELRSMHAYDFATDSPAGRPRYEELYRRFLAGEETTSEVEGRLAGGRIVWVTASVRPIRDERGNVVATQSIFVDITDRKRAEEALAESEARYRELYDDAPAAYGTVDPGGNITGVNRRLTEMFGYPAEEIIGRGPVEFFADTSTGKPVVQRIVERYLEGGEVTNEEAEGRRKDGSPVWVRISFRTVRDAEGRPVEARVMLVDVTAERRVQEELRRVARDAEYLREEIRREHNVEEIVGRSAALGEVLRKVGLVAGTDSSVLVLGETGTGKELVARALHSGSPRRERPLVKVNCAALPAGLIESELFGHEKGAFTGALERRIGRFELADRGTIFLDEIGELPLETQVKLLRVLQEREFERLGGAKTIRVDVRVIAATNRDLARAVAEGKFRQDLYYRLNVFPISVPPLRDRAEDIPLLVQFFLARFAIKIGRPIERVPAEAMVRFAVYSWPGNVRELENVIERAVILSPGPELQVPAELLAVEEESPPKLPAPQPTPTRAEVASLEDVERQHILAVLKRSGWRIEGDTGAARTLGLNPSTLRSRIKKLGIQRSREAVS